MGEARRIVLEQRPRSLDQQAHRGQPLRRCRGIHPLPHVTIPRRYVYGRRRG
jgi:hypothetical protein